MKTITAEEIISKYPKYIITSLYRNQLYCNSCGKRIAANKTNQAYIYFRTNTDICGYCEQCKKLVFAQALTKEDFKYQLKPTTDIIKLITYKKFLELRESVETLCDLGSEEEELISFLKTTYNNHVIEDIIR
jgi:thioredoxin-related protein